MSTSIRSLAITLVALISFVFIAEDLMWDVQTWECNCLNEECEWCTVIDDEWSEFHELAYLEATYEFDELFNALTATSLAKGNEIRVMVRRANGRIARCVLIESTTMTSHTGRKSPVILRSNQTQFETAV